MSISAVGTLGIANTISVGGIILPLKGLITLVGQGNNHTTLRKAGSQVGAGYQVTAGKTLSIYAVRVGNDVGGGTSGIPLLQSDNDVGLNSGTAFTNPVFFGSESSTASVLLCVTATLGAYAEISGNPLGIIAALKYMSVDFNQGGNNCGIIAFGYET